jgi:hypothetical protein
MSSGDTENLCTTRRVEGLRAAPHPASDARGAALAVAAAVAVATGVPAAVSGDVDDDADPAAGDALHEQSAAASTNGPTRIHRAGEGEVTPSIVA